MKIEVELSSELFERVQQFATDHAISDAEAVLFIIADRMSGPPAPVFISGPHHRPVPSGGEEFMKGMEGAIQAGKDQMQEQAAIMRRTYFMQGAALLTQSSLMEHDEVEKIWERFLDFYGRLESKVLGEDLANSLGGAHGQDDDR